MRTVLLIAALTFSVLSLLILVWVVVPAPFYVLWLVALVAGEWSLFAGLAGAIGAILGSITMRMGASWGGGVAVVCDIIAIALSLYPLLSALPVAAAYSIDLSLPRYLLGSSIDTAVSVQTYAYANHEEEVLNLDMYRRQQSPSIHGSTESGEALQPAIIVIHGGSWKSGERSDFPIWNRWLASSGYTVFDIDYRLQPQPNYATALEDVRLAIRWVKENAARFEVDSSRIALLGRSAGGHLALLAGYTATTPSDHVKAVIALYAPTDLSWAYDHPANQHVIDGPATLRDFIGGTPDNMPEVYNAASPIDHVTMSTPPTLLFHGGHDQLVRPENSQRLTERLRHSGMDSTATVSVSLPYAQHGFDYNVNGWGSQIAQGVMLDFLHRWL